MKTVLKLLAAALFAVLLAWGVRYIYAETAAIQVDGTSPTTLFEAALLDAREMFVEKADAIQLLTAALVEEGTLSIQRSAEGEPLLVEDGVAVGPYTPATEEAEISLQAVFGDYACGGALLHITVTPDAVIFYTYYHDGGVAGFLYEKNLGETAYYKEYFELVENWKLFYEIGQE